MLQAGDELGHSQGGNDNAYCQDNELTWLDRQLDDDGNRITGTASCSCSTRPAARRMVKDDHRPEAHSAAVLLVTRPTA